MRRLTTDVLVIGGGATGAGVARDAALRGLSCVLVERGGLAGGTTGRFHGLLHSGARYVVTDTTSAAECHRESQTLRGIAAGCIEDCGGYFVETPADDPAYAERFVAGCGAARIPCREVPVPEALLAEPGLNPRVRRVFAVPDASVDGRRVVSGCARSAREHGATVLTRHPVVNLVVQDGGVAGAVVRDVASGQDVEIRAPMTVNAAGAWAGRIALLAGCQVSVVAGRGVMVALSRRLARAVINRCRLPGDGDILVPMGTSSVIGTTDAASDDPDDLSVTRAEVQSMLDQGELLIPGLRQAGAVRAWAGVRALFTPTTPAGGDRELSRSHQLLDHGQRDGIDGLVSIVGGKFTTFRLMAEITVDLVGARLGVTGPCTTASEPLPGGEGRPPGVSATSRC